LISYNKIPEVFIVSWLVIKMLETFIVC